MTTNKEGQLSDNKIRLAFNEKYYKGHFNSIENLKRVLTETQKVYSQNDDDTRVKNKCIEILKKVQKQLIEMENKTPEVMSYYSIKKKELES